ncbi:hypothetical protein BH11VER1_BH11VER1_06130 [soil metagenome]
MVELATNIEQPPPPLPAEEGQPEEWLSLGVYVLTQEEKGEGLCYQPGEPHSRRLARRDPLR